MLRNQPQTRFAEELQLHLRAQVRADFGLDHRSSFFCHSSFQYLGAISKKNVEIEDFQEILLYSFSTYRGNQYSGFSVLHAHHIFLIYTSSTPAAPFETSKMAPACCCGPGLNVPAGTSRVSQPVVSAVDETDLNAVLARVC